jgi:hypothetical protein
MGCGSRAAAGCRAYSRKARWKHGGRSREIREVLRANRNAGGISWRYSGEARTLAVVAIPASGSMRDPFNPVTLT